MVTRESPWAATPEQKDWIAWQIRPLTYTVSGATHNGTSLRPGPTALRALADLKRAARIPEDFLGMQRDLACGQRIVFASTFSLTRTSADLRYMTQEQFRTVEGRFKVYFSCRGCGTIYSASQERSSTPASGLFSCLNCGKPVHHWSGIYDYTDWKCVFKA